MAARTRPALNDPKPARPPAWGGRGTVALSCAALCFVVFLAYAGGSWPLALYALLTDGLCALVWLLAAYGFGSLLPLPEGGRAMHGVTRIAIGLGAMSLGVLGLGLAGWLSAPVALSLVAAGVFLSVFREMRRRRGQSTVRPHHDERCSAWSWLWLAAMPFLAMALVAAFVPPGVLWGDEPNGYDVVEYHLQIPREWYEAGRITGLHHNVFSYFPFNIEMQYLLAMHVRGGPWAGMYLAQLMHVGYVALSVAAVYAAARAAGAGTAGATIAGVCAATTPWLALLAPVAYNEGGLLLYGTLAVGWTLHALRDAERRVAAMAIAGAMAGLACGVKLTAGPMLLVPLPLALVTIATIRREAIGRACLASILFAAVGLALFSPWLARNIAWTGNPVFPEAQRVLGRAHFTEKQATRWSAAHSPRADQQSVAARLGAAWRQIGWDARYGFVLLPLALVCAAVSCRRPETWLLLGVLVAFAGVWLGLTHLQGRFFVLAIPVAALLVAQVSGRAALGTAVGATLLAVFGFAVLHARTTRFLHEKQLAQLLGFETLSAFMVPDVARELPADAPLTLVGDAKAFCYQRPMSQLRYRTVFDVGPGEDWLAAWVGGPIEANTMILVDPGELGRFSRTYRGLPPVPEEVLQRPAPFPIRPEDRP